MKQEPLDSGWLSRNEDVLFADVRRGLNQPPLFHDAVKLLMRIFPYYALVQMHTHRWWPLLLDALADAQNLRDNDMIIQILTQLGESYIVFGKHAEAKTVFSQAMKRAGEKQIKEMLLTAYIGLIKVETTQISSGFTRDIAQHAIRLALQVSDRSLKATLCQTLATVYAYRKETELGLGHGQTAYGLWQQLGNQLELGRTAIVLSQIYRTCSRFDRAAYFLELAQEHFARTDLERQEAVTAYEKGSLCLEQRDPESARVWLELALEEYQQRGMDNHIAGASHALALALIELGELDKARANLQAALATWEGLKYWHEQANALYALGYLDYQDKRYAQARKAWEQALQVCDQLPDAAVRSTLEAQIIGALKDLDDLRPDS
jgi:tetratricopeptide (TPR) repeat protein